MTEDQIVTKVRAKTVRDENLLPDYMILYFATESGDNDLSDGSTDWNGVYADAWDWIAGLDIYGAHSEGNVSVSQPQAIQRALYYRSLSRSGGGVGITVGVVRRTDMLEPSIVTGSEFNW